MAAPMRNGMHGPDNWDVGAVPNATDDIIIPSGLSTWPDVNAAAGVNDVIIQDAARVDMSSNVLLNVMETG